MSVPKTPPESLSIAQGLVENTRAHQASLTGRKIRVVRALTYEGESSAVFEQLARSLPIGKREFVKGCLSITVAQGEPELVVEPATDPDAIFDIDTLILGLPETGPQIRQLLDNALKR